MCIEILKKEDCCGCSACYNICPVNCIEMKEDTEGFTYPYVQAEKCISCGMCEKICPIMQKSVKKEEITQREVLSTYACINQLEETRRNSSSGGIFTLLAQRIIEEGGVVYGVAFAEDKTAIHIEVREEKDLYQLQGSKYMQSSKGEVYKEIKENLENGKIVLFSGTPCENAGLKSFLQKDYDKLFCVDIICHGVPSPLVWKMYLDSLGRRFGEVLRRESNPSFRSKTEGWIRYSVSIPFSHNTEYRKGLDEDLFMQTFLRNINLRPSCYQCQFKPSTNISDITLADFWGIEKIMPEMFDDKGTSLVIINSEKGQALFDFIKDKMKYKKTDYKEAVYYNKSAYQSVTMPDKRKEFFSRINEENIEELMKRLTKDTLYIRCRKRLGRIKRIILKKLETKKK